MAASFVAAASVSAQTGTALAVPGGKPPSLTLTLPGSILEGDTILAFMSGKSLTDNTVEPMPIMDELTGAFTEGWYLFAPSGTGIYNGYHPPVDPYYGQFNGDSGAVWWHEAVASDAGSTITMTWPPGMGIAALALGVVVLRGVVLRQVGAPITGYADRYAYGYSDLPYFYAYHEPFVDDGILVGFLAGTRPAGVITPPAGWTLAFTETAGSQIRCAAYYLPVVKSGSVNPEKFLAGTFPKGWLTQVGTMMQLSTRPDAVVAAGEALDVTTATVTAGSANSGTDSSPAAEKLTPIPPFPKELQIPGTPYIPDR